MTTVELFPKINIMVFRSFGRFDAFSFQALIKGKYLSIKCFVTCYCLKTKKSGHLFTIIFR